MGFNTIHMSLMIPTPALAGFRKWMRDNLGASALNTVDVVDGNADLTRQNLIPKFHSIGVTCTPEAYTSIKKMLNKSPRTRSIVMSGRAANTAAKRRSVERDSMSRANVKRADGRIIPDVVPVGPNNRVR